MAERRQGRMPPPPPGSRRPIVASARRVRPKAAEFTRSQRAWQEQCWAYYDEIGEIKFAGGFYARTLSKIELYPAVKSEDGKSIQRITDPEVVGVLERLQDATGTRARLQARYGIQRFVVGESFLCCTGRDGGEEWEMLSGDELRANADGTYVRDDGSGSGPIPFREAKGGDQVQDGEMMVWRLWASHPRKSGEADSPLRGVRESCDRLLTLGRAIRARGLNRVAGAGILILSDSITSLDAEPLPEGDDGQPAGDATEAPEEDPVFREIYESMMEPIEDEGSASAVVPVMLRVPRDEVESAMKWFRLSDESAGYPEAAQVEQEIQRIALGLDMPAEALTGVADMNHWSAWVVSREAWQSHGQPVVEEFCADLTSAYFRPAADQLEKTTVTVDDRGNEATVPVGPGQMFVWYDSSDVVLNPDKATDAKDAHDRDVISDNTLRETLGFEPNDAPSEEELADRRAAKAAQKPVAPGQGEAPSGTDETPPVEAAALAGMVALAVARSIEAAGGKFRATLQGNRAARDEYRNVPNRRLCATAGPGLVRSLCGEGCEPALVANVVEHVLGESLNGNKGAILAEVERLAIEQLYVVGPVALDDHALDVIRREAR